MTLVKPDSNISVTQAKSNYMGQESRYFLIASKQIILLEAVIHVLFNKILFTKLKNLYTEYKSNVTQLFFPRHVYT